MKVQNYNTLLPGDRGTDGPSRRCPVNYRGWQFLQVLGRAKWDGMSFLSLCCPGHMRFYTHVISSLLLFIICSSKGISLSNWAPQKFLCLKIATIKSLDSYFGFSSYILHDWRKSLSIQGGSDTDTLLVMRAQSKWKTENRNLAETVRKIKVHLEQSCFAPRG